MIILPGIKDVFAYGKTPNSYDLLKFLAIFTMVIDHIGYFFFPDIEGFSIIGRLAYPLFLFLVGYSNNFKTSWTLFFLGAFIEVVEHSIISHEKALALNILLGIFFTRLIFKYLKKIKWLNSERGFEILFVSSLFFLPTALFFEYGTLSILFAYSGWLLKNRKSDKEYQNYLIFTALTLTLNLIVQKSIFFSEYSSSFSLGFVGISIILFIILYDFRVGDLEIKIPTPFNVIFLFVARNSLVIYYTHFIIFRVISAYLFPERFS